MGCPVARRKLLPSSDARNLKEPPGGTRRPWKAAGTLGAGRSGEVARGACDTAIAVWACSAVNDSKPQNIARIVTLNEFIEVPFVIKINVSFAEYCS
jgi:hypothetical protein